MIPRTSASIALALALAAPLGAQNVTVYRHAPGDTLRYHELTEGKVDATESRREATLVVAFGGGDNAQAWFESFSAVVRVQGREMNPPAPPSSPVPVLFGANGTVQLATQTGPAGNPFATYFLKLPDRSLAAGVEWADTSGWKRELPDGTKSEMQYIVKYKVVGDTAVGGGKALVIASKGDGTEKATRIVPSIGTTDQRIRTFETGRIVFSAELGRLLSWERTVDRSGRTTTRGTESNPNIGSRGGPTRMADMTAPEAKGRETHGRTHTLIELVGPAQLKAAPAK